MNEISQTPSHMALTESMAAANIIVLIDESLLILEQKRQTLEEKIIANYFRRLVGAYTELIGTFHKCVPQDESTANEVIAMFARLRTVNEKVRACVEELLKILKYNFNYLEQYFEHDYCARLLNDPELLVALEEIQVNLQTLLCNKSATAHST